ncbi:hypothetical protein VNO80_05877 [Phaseolus coccineus]|uniref:Uncharacterized protein n=1 Tax=Phaseolus coccineus TaxID=3886 RepID=A0AAN9NGH8_PHACN
MPLAPIDPCPTNPTPTPQNFTWLSKVVHINAPTCLQHLKSISAHHSRPTNIHVDCRNTNTYSIPFAFFFLDNTLVSPSKSTSNHYPSLLPCCPSLKEMANSCISFTYYTCNVLLRTPALHPIGISSALAYGPRQKLQNQKP